MLIGFWLISSQNGVIFLVSKQELLYEMNKRAYLLLHTKYCNLALSNFDYLVLIIT